MCNSNLHLCSISFILNTFSAQKSFLCLDSPPKYIINAPNLILQQSFKMNVYPLKKLSILNWIICYLQIQKWSSDLHKDNMHTQTAARHVQQLIQSPVCLHQPDNTALPPLPWKHHHEGGWNYLALTLNAFMWHHMHNHVFLFFCFLLFPLQITSF